MKYERSRAKEYSRANFRGIWAAALTPFKSNGSLDQKGLASNLTHWFDDLKIDGAFISGKQGEFFSMSVEERKRTCEIAVEAAKGKAGVIMSCSDQNLDVVLDLARHAQTAGADYIVVHAPMLHFVHDRDELIYQYYKHISEQVDIGIALWSHPDSGYLMSPELCARLAEIETVVAIKYSVPREMYAKLTELAGDKILVSTASEDEWLDNIIDLKWQLYLCSSPPYLLQSKNDLRMREYTDLAFAGDFEKARVVRDSLEPVRQALKRTKPGGKPQSSQKHWQDLLGQVGGQVRRPMLEMTNDEKRLMTEAFQNCGLKP